MSGHALRKCIKCITDCIWDFGDFDNKSPFCEHRPQKTVPADDRPTWFSQHGRGGVKTGGPFLVPIKKSPPGPHTRIHAGMFGLGGFFAQYRSGKDFPYKTIPCFPQNN